MAEYSPLDDLVDRVMDAADEWHFDGINTTQFQNVVRGTIEEALNFYKPEEQR
jgi:hypothetical protein